MSSIAYWRTGAPGSRVRRQSGVILVGRSRFELRSPSPMCPEHVEGPELVYVPQLVEGPPEPRLRKASGGDGATLCLRPSSSLRRLCICRRCEVMAQPQGRRRLVSVTASSL
jgi:hypothetical protein